MKITVKSKFHNYKVRIEDDYACFRGVALSTLKGKKICIYSDANFNADEIISALKGYEVYPLNSAGGERTKTVDQALTITEFLYKHDFARGDALIVVGGGTISDIAGFAAAIYMRGIKYITVPTTLLSAVDACVGGKTAADAFGGKNILGAFYPPSAVYIAEKTIKNLPGQEIFYGKGEIVKYAFIDESLTAGDLEKVPDGEVIYKCLKIKAKFVGKDEFDCGKRKILNLGHTAAHAYEAASGFTLPHGEAVARGLYKIIKVSQKYYGFTDEKAEKMRDLLRAAGFDEKYDCDLPHAPLNKDKKSCDGNIDLVLLKDTGKPRIVNLSIKKAEEIFEW